MISRRALGLVLLLSGLSFLSAASGVYVRSLSARLGSSLSLSAPPDSEIVFMVSKVLDVSHDVIIDLPDEIPGLKISVEGVYNGWRKEILVNGSRLHLRFNPPAHGVYMFRLANPSNSSLEFSVRVARSYPDEVEPIAAWLLLASIALTSASILVFTHGGARLGRGPRG